MAPRKLKRAASAEELSKVGQDQEENKVAPKRGKGKVTKNMPKSDVIDEHMDIDSEHEDSEVVPKVAKGRGKKKEPVSKSNGTAKADSAKVKKGQHAGKSNDDIDTEVGKLEDEPVVTKRSGRQVKSSKESEEEEVGDVKAPKTKKGRSAKESAKDDNLEHVLEEKENSKATKSKKGPAAKPQIEEEEETENDEVPEEEPHTIEMPQGKPAQGKKAIAVVKPTGRGGRRKKAAAEEPEEEVEDASAEPEEGKKVGAKPKRGKAAPKAKRGKAAAKESEYVDIDGKELRVSIEH